MAGQTLTEKYQELYNLVTDLRVEIRTLRDDLNEVRSEQEKTRETLTAIKIELALLGQQMSELRKGKDEWGRRLWVIVPPIVAVVTGILIGYLLRR